jgi:hypothetical protein
MGESLDEHIEQRGNKWVITNKTKTKVLGTHDTKEKAVNQLQAIEANK